MRVPRFSLSPALTVGLAAVLLAVLGSLLGSVPAFAHPYHASYAEVELNAETGKLEVALKLPTLDLERALSSVSKKIDLDAEEADGAILTYLQSSFRVTCGEAGEPGELIWVGKEIEARASWLYFEVPVSQGLAGCTLRNTLLLELEPTQLNTVKIVSPGYNRTITLSRDQPSHTIPETD